MMKIYFYCCPPGPPENTGYEHQIICLAEGFKKLGVEFHGNINYWQNQPGGDFLIRSDGEDFKNCDVVVFSASSIEFNQGQSLPVEMLSRKRKHKNVFIDDSDGLITPGFKWQEWDVDIVLKSHFNAKHRYPRNFVPWQFGLTERIIESVTPVSSHKRSRYLLTNFRVKHPVRDVAQKVAIPLLANYFPTNNETDAFEPAIEFDECSYHFWKQTGRRHYPSYYTRLSNTLASAAFGGYLQKSIQYKKGFLSKCLRKIDSKLNFLQSDIVYQFDSWRFWESLAAGCCTFHIDLEKYGGVLPIMPKNGKQYVGVNFSDVSKLQRLLRNQKALEEIGESGREWVLENYTPVKIASRFIEIPELDLS